MARFEKTLQIDSENVAALHGLDLCYEKLGDPERAKRNRVAHLRVKADDNAEGIAVRAAREKYPAANFAAEALDKLEFKGELRSTKSCANQWRYSKRRPMRSACDWWPHASIGRKCWDANNTCGKRF